MAAAHPLDYDTTVTFAGEISEETPIVPESKSDGGDGAKSFPVRNVQFGTRYRMQGDPDLTLAHPPDGTGHGRIKCGYPRCVSLHDPSSCVNLIRHDDDSAELSSLWGSRHPYRPKQVRRTISAGATGNAHRPRDHDWLGPLVEQIENEAGLFEGVGALRHDYSICAICEEFAYRRGQFQHVNESQTG